LSSQPGSGVGSFARAWFGRGSPPGRRKGKKTLTVGSIVAMPPPLQGSINPRSRPGPFPSRRSSVARSRTAAEHAQSPLFSVEMAHSKGLSASRPESRR
jgi:hypothetical protein